MPCILQGPFCSDAHTRMQPLPLFLFLPAQHPTQPAFHELVDHVLDDVGFDNRGDECHRSESEWLVGGL